VRPLRRIQPDVGYGCIGVHPHPQSRSARELEQLGSMDVCVGKNGSRMICEEDPDPEGNRKGPQERKWLVDEETVA